MELRQLLRTLRRRWKFIVVVFFLGIAGAAALTSTITPQYNSTARVYVTATATGSADALQQGIYSAQRISSYADLAKSTGVLAQVIRQTGVRMTTDELAGHITTTPVPNTVILKIDVTDADPKVAQRLADAEADQIVALVSTLETPKETSTGEKIAAPIIAKQSGDASFSSVAVSPNLTVNLVVGAMLGLLMGLAGAVLRDLFDTSIKNGEDLVEATESAVMAVIPYDSSVPKHPLITDHEGHQERVEAFRVLRTNLQFIDLDSERQMLVISSAVPDEGKTVTASNLAITLAQTGRRVLLMDCDLRKPSVAQVLGLENSVGLITVLVGRAGLSDCIQQHESGIDFLATGPLPPNPAEVLETQSMRDLLAQLRDEYDVVIIDAPPLLPVADPSILAAQVDGVLLVTRHGKTNREYVHQAVTRVGGVGGRVVGVVLNMAPRRAVSGYGYGYGYGYGEPVAVERLKGDTGSRRVLRADGKHTHVPGRAR
ncbi:MAG: tyrosine-protein kinase [Nocardioidaceae bacterium]|nr:tyrosine-protein kinase [Nocardioidaceae bacterium]